MKRDTILTMAKKLAFGQKQGMAGYRRRAVGLLFPRKKAANDSRDDTDNEVHNHLAASTKESC
jgi:hypothetical protein